MTKGELADALEVSTRSLLAYEKEEKRPKSATVLRMAEVLAFPVEFFFGPDLDEPSLDGSSFRSLRRLTAQRRDRALAAGAIALRLSDWIESQFVLPTPDIPRCDGLSPEMAAIAVRNSWKLGERPISNMIHLLEAHGVRVLSLAEDCRELDAFSFWRGDLPYAFTNTVKSSEHRRMDGAHELGHLVLHRYGAIRARGSETEHEAQRFASAFLMPSGDVLAQAPRSPGVAELVQAKRRWNVSAVSLAYRMHVLGLLTEWHYRDLMINMSQLGYRTDEPKSSKAESSQVLDKVFAALKAEGKSKLDVAREVGVPLDELQRVVFGLVLTSLEGNGSMGTTDVSDSRPTLRVVG